MREPADFPYRKAVIATRNPRGPLVLIVAGDAETELNVHGAVENGSSMVVIAATPAGLSDTLALIERVIVAHETPQTIH